MAHYLIVNELSDFKPGDRVESHPATDLWMQGLRYGDVVRLGRTKVSVKFDRSERPRLVHPRNLLKIDVLSGRAI